MDLHRLSVFVKVFELGSLSRSAEAVYLSQPTVSGHLKRLEEELGVRLFDRLGRGVVPTQAAEVLYDYALRLLALREEAVKTVAAVDGQVRGQLIVGASTIPGHYLLPGYLTQMRLLYPKLTVSLVLGDTAGIAQKVEEGQVEMGVIGARLNNSRLSQTPCCQDELVLAAGAGHPLAGQGRVEVDQLRDLPFLLREAGSGTRMVTAKALAKLGLRLSELTVAAELGSTEAIRQGILAGLGVSILSRLAVEDDFAAGRLVEVEVEGLSLKRDFFLIVRSGKSLSPGGQKLADLLDQEDDHDRRSA
ncbi:MAG: LysR family transcriptional regulator [Deltaproteobacteria bacterium]|nr:LysR family transcriptional regulator [Deltaproteobacteria bacterium]